MNIVYKQSGEENTEIRVTKIELGYSVTFWDLDVNESLPYGYIFRKIDDAINYAKKYK